MEPTTDTTIHVFQPQQGTGTVATTVPTPFAFNEITLRETDSVLVRLSASLKTQATFVAEYEQVSANALYSAGVLYATLIYGTLPVIGRPENLYAFIDEIDHALEGAPIVGAFNEVDWNDVKWVLERLIEVAWVKDVRVRRDVKAASTIVYHFTLTKTGRHMWGPYGQALRERYEKVPKGQESLFAPKNDITADVAQR